MRIISLKLENFMGYRGKAKLELDRLGLAQISGTNHDDPANDSNGSGKSTILEAITWCLFGEGLPRRQGNSEKGVQAAEVLNDRAPRQCRVEVVLADDDAVGLVVTDEDADLEAPQYVVARWRKWKPAAKGKQSTGVSLTINGQLEESLDTSETDRRIREVLGISRDIWTRSVVFGQESAFNFCESTAKERQDILTTVMGLERIDRWQGRARDERKQVREELARAEGGIKALWAILADYEAHDPEADARAWTAERQGRMEEAQADLAEAEAAGKALKAALEAFQMGPEPALDRPDPELRAKAAAAEKAAQEAYTAAGAANAVLAAAQLQYQQIAGLTAGALCPTCHQTILEAHRDNCLAQAGQQQEVAQAQALTATAALASCQARAQSAAKAGRDAHEQALASHAARAAWERQRNEQQKLLNQVDLARERWRQCRDDLARIQAESNPFAGQAEAHKAKLEAARAEVEAEERVIENLRAECAVLDWWDRELPRLKTWLFDSIVDSLAAEANRWLRVMSGGTIWIQIATQVMRGKQLKDEIDVQIHRWNPDGTTTCRPYRVWSGGEKRRVALAVDLGLSRLMGSRASKAYRFLALDEVDRHLDRDGREGLRQVLEELKAERETALVVTHDPDFKASFDVELAVQKRDGKSAVEVKRATA